jgi:hypothetical protein
LSALPPRPNGQSTAKIAAAVISANTNHSAIKQVPVKRRQKESTNAPLYTTGAKPGNRTILNSPRGLEIRKAQRKPGIS